MPIGGKAASAAGSAGASAAGTPASQDSTATFSVLSLAPGFQLWVWVDSA